MATEDMKIRPTPEQKRLFEKAAEEAKPVKLSLTQWVIAACIEKAERDGVTMPKRKAAR